MRLACLVVAAAGALGCHGSTGNSSTGNTGPACPTASELNAAAPQCNTISNTAKPIPFTLQTGAPPADTGGTIIDGLYESVAASGYGSAAPAGRRITLVIAGGATQFSWAGEVLDAAGANVTLAFRANAHATSAGNQVSFTVDCSSSTPSPIPPSLTYTASASQLIMSRVTGADASVTTYARVPCR